MYLPHKGWGVMWQSVQGNNSELCQNSSDITAHYCWLSSGFIAPSTYKILSFAEAVPAFWVVSTGSKCTYYFNHNMVDPRNLLIHLLECFSSHVLLTEWNEDFALTFYDLLPEMWKEKWYFLNSHWGQYHTTLSWTSLSCTHFCKFLLTFC